MKNFDRDIFGSSWIYPEMMERGYKALVYSGNSDTKVPTLGSQKWIQALNMTRT